MIKKANCMFCHRNCGMLIEVKDGKVVKVRSNPDRKISPGSICIGLNPLLLLKQINENLECLWKWAERPAHQPQKAKTSEALVT